MCHYKIVVQSPIIEFYGIVDQFVYSTIVEIYENIYES
jgi:hypothetical protein